MTAPYIVPTRSPPQAANSPPESPDKRKVPSSPPRAQPQEHLVPTQPRYLWSISLDIVYPPNSARLQEWEIRNQLFISFDMNAPTEHQIDLRLINVQTQQTRDAQPDFLFYYQISLRLIQTNERQQPTVSQHTFDITPDEGNTLTDLKFLGRYLSGADLEPGENPFSIECELVSALPLETLIPPAQFALP